MRPNFFHSSSSSISWQQQQQRNKGPFVPFPSPNHMNIDSSSSTHMNYNKEGDEIQDEHHHHELMTSLEKEHMFDKVVTPSDVGKLNRLVIPKQHAEKYFPLDSSTNEKGLLLNFEDRNGKPWRFRYSYWNSSQSYVMTKGWSRFVKDKKLDAGDIVSFSRGVGDLEKDHFFIDWRRRPTAPLPPPLPLSTPTPPLLPGHHYYSFHPWPPGRSSDGVGVGGGGPYILQQRSSCVRSSSRDHPPQLQQINVMNPSSYSYGGGLMNGNPCPGSLIYFRSPAPHQQHVVPASGMGIGMMQGQRGEDSIEDDDDPMVFESVPVVVQGKAASKRFRLFGVNMECPISEDSSDIDISETHTILSSTAVTHHYPSMAANPQSGHFCSSSSSTSSSMRAYPYAGAPLVRKMSSSSSSDKILNKGKGSLSLDFD